MLNCISHLNLLLCSRNYAIDMSFIRLRYITYSLLFFLLLDANATLGQIQQSEIGISKIEAFEKACKSIDDTIKILYLQRESDPDATIKALERIGEKSLSIGYKYGYAKTGVSIANIIINLKPEEDVKEALVIQKKIKDIILTDPKAEQKKIELWYQQMGSCYSIISEFDSAMHYYSQALNIGLKKRNKTLEDTATLAVNYINLADMFLQMQQYEKVIYYARQCLPIAQNKLFKEQLFQSYAILTDAFIKLNNTDSAQKYLTLMMGTDYERPELEEKIYHETIGSFYLLKKDYLNAIKYFKKSTKINDYPSNAGLKGLGICYLMLKNYNLAEFYLLEAEKELIQLKTDNILLVSVYAHLAAVYDSTNNFEKAYKYRNLEYALQKEIDNASKTRIVNQLEGEYRKAEQDKQLVLNEIQLMQFKSKLQNQRTLIIGISLLVLLLLTALGLFYQKNKIQKQKSEAQLRAQEIDKLKAAIEAEEKERSRIGRELHDDIMVQLSLVKMNIEALPAAIPEIEKLNDFISLKEQLRVTGRDLRQTAHNLSPDTLLADGLTQALLYFFKNVQYRTKLKINFQYYGQAVQLPQETEINIYRIAQELIQNIIKHAKAKNILIQLSYRQDMLTLTIEDDGIGFSTKKDNQNEGIGLKSIRSRLKVLKGTMDIHTKNPQGTSITIEINF